MFAMNMTRERQKAQNLDQAQRNSSEAQQRKLQRAAEREEAKMKAREDYLDSVKVESENNKSGLDHMGHTDEPKKSHTTLADAMRKKKNLNKEKSVESDSEKKN